MALKFKFTRATLDIVPDGTATAMVYFRIRDDADPAKLSAGLEDDVQFTPGFPLTKASLRSDATAAITTRYPGATEE